VRCAMPQRCTAGRRLLQLLQLMLHLPAADTPALSARS